VPPPNPPLSGSQVRELDKNLNRINSGNSKISGQQQLPYQQQHAEIRAQIERHHMMRLQEQELERNR
jgi:hypothetical protein